MRTPIKLVVMFAALGLVAAACGGGTDTGTTGTTPPQTTAACATTVDSADFEFKPKDVTVKVGSCVEWKFVGATPHTVTADDGAFDSGQKTTGTYKRTFSTAGKVPYYCTLHGQKGGQGMAGTVTVTA